MEKADNVTFNELEIIEPILKAVKDMGYQSPTEVQKQAIPHILKGKDMIVLSKTGSGKTASFGIPMLQNIDFENNVPQGLVITPTRELAVQVDKDLKELGKYLPHNTTAIYGQHSINTEIQELKKGVHIVTGTPGRIFDHIQKGTLNTKNIKFLVLDEADRMLDMGFIDQVQQIIKKIPKERVTMLFSATLPDEIQKICHRYLNNPETVSIESETKTVDSIEQIYYRVNYDEKRRQLNRILTIERPEGCIIFCNTKRSTDQVHNFLLMKGYASQALHGDIPQGRRLSIINDFKKGVFPILVATDVAARGIHIEGLCLVINYDLPVEKDSYVHRIGRTGRAGHDGKAISLVTSEDIMSLYEIEEHTGAMIEEKDLPSDSFYNENKPAAEKWKLSKKPKPKVIPKQAKTVKPAVKTEKKIYPKVQTKVQPSASVQAKVQPQPSLQEKKTITEKKSFFKKIIDKIFGK